MKLKLHCFKPKGIQPLNFDGINVTRSSKINEIRLKFIHSTVYTTTITNLSSLNYI